MIERPQTRGDCVDGGRPCPWVGCRYHLAVEVERYCGYEKRYLRVQAEDLEDLAETCALDIADQGPHTLNEIGQLLGVTRERVRQIEEKAIRKLVRSLKRVGIDEEVMTMIAGMPDSMLGQAQIGR